MTNTNGPLLRKAPAMNGRCRSGRHVLRVPTDRRSNGQCAACSRDNEAKYRRNRRDAYAAMKSLQIA